MSSRWGDVFDDSDEEDDDVGVAPTMTSTTGTGLSARLEIPPTHKTRPDSKGIQIITSYRAMPNNAQKLIKTVTKVRVHTIKSVEHKDVAVRRKWKKFGQAALDDDTSNVTIQSRDDIYVEDPNADLDLQDQDKTQAISGDLNEFWAKQQRRKMERKYGVDGADGEGGGADAAGAGGGLGGAGGAGGGGGWTQVSSGSGGRYVPPSQRAGAKVMGSSAGGPQRNDDMNTIRVTNISENTTEADLQDLFQPFGRISRVYLAKDKETMLSRGFAFVSFVHKEDAQRAMDKLQGFGYDHLILKLEWARPSAPKDPSSSGTEYRSGYGKALAQDTKEKVSFASNLTRGVR
eukprot:CAMPEP_0194049170 /NCGR_PEP_ID=MMETSP0009_2-20130614/29904_1 /TAXON_ID=210454 /ORGANISM="Grammatophora oceanica, Strain CCMP 410" /LENGTH=345 /DNA_ID=CAMNT_0038695255 /DNA_START=66 /DNA_END=1103 /DNA_ORIENTATION=+